MKVSAAAAAAAALLAAPVAARPALSDMGTRFRLKECETFHDCGGFEGYANIPGVYADAEKNNFAEPLSCTYCFTLPPEQDRDDISWCVKKPPVSGTALEKASNECPCSSEDEVQIASSKV
ncbi:hypothetical protein O9K51_00464 [Purpureocillium lavendulum]|uniref:Uncharacterized protein n=1 Tax=Purpureocillium lavendulum TaxID=1247861 RepID=A0AB34G4F9_9HYPO|nr:hypothetical protein O9K51_00464 [Purpureocillium lavendulum]